MLNLPKKEATSDFSSKDKILSAFFEASTNSSKYRFARVDSNFEKFLPYLKEGAIKLYIYYLMKANNKTGVSWHSVKTIADALGVTDRSVSNWNSQLEDFNLIVRDHFDKQSKSTFVLPLTDYIIKYTQDEINQLFTEINLLSSGPDTKVFGKLNTAFTLYFKGKNITKITCMYLERNYLHNNTNIHCAKTFLYYEETLDKTHVINQTLHSKTFDKEIYSIVQKETIILGNRQIQSNNYFINSVKSTAEDMLFKIMCELTDSSSDLSQLPKLSTEKKEET